MARARLERVYSKLDPSKYSFKIVFEDDNLQHRADAVAASGDYPWTKFGYLVNHDDGPEYSCKRHGLSFNYTKSSILCVPNKTFPTDGSAVFTEEDFRLLCVLSKVGTVLCRDDTWEPINLGGAFHRMIQPLEFFTHAWRIFEQGGFRVESIGISPNADYLMAIARHHDPVFEYQGSRFIRYALFGMPCVGSGSPTLIHCAYEVYSDTVLPVDLSKFVPKQGSRAHQRSRKVNAGVDYIFSNFSTEKWDQDWDRWKLYIKRLVKIQAKPMEVARLCILMNFRWKRKMRLGLVEDLTKYCTDLPWVKRKVDSYIEMFRTSPYLTTQATQDTLFGALICAFHSFYTPSVASTFSGFRWAIFDNGFGLKRDTFEFARRRVKEIYGENVSSRSIGKDGSPRHVSIGGEEKG